MIKICLYRMLVYEKLHLLRNRLMCSPKQSHSERDRFKNLKKEIGSACGIGQNTLLAKVKTSTVTDSHLKKNKQSKAKLLLFCICTCNWKISHFSKYFCGVAAMPLTNQGPPSSPVMVECLDCVSATSVCM